jgi:predicted amidohydrolase YtcJ
MRRPCLLLLVLIGIVACEDAPAPAPGPSAEVTAPTTPARVLVAQRIITMDSARPTAHAVAIRDGRIVAVGSEAEVVAAAGPGAEVDRSHERAGRILMAGFIENHLHPMMAAVLLPMEFVTPYDWHLAGRKVEGVRGQEAYRARLRELQAGLADPDEPLFAWGYHAMFHGPLARADLNEISSTRPIIAWHRSFHEVIVNDAALEWMALDPAAVENHHQIDIGNGHFYETGLAVALAAFAPTILSPEWLSRGIELTVKTVHRGGITTVADMAAGLFDLETEWALQKRVLGDESVPFRTLFVPAVPAMIEKFGAEQALAEIDALPERNTDKLRFVRQVKLLADGAFFSQLMMMKEGYLDGHHGEWLMEPELLAREAARYWDAGYQLHVHANGDAGVEATLDVLTELLARSPRKDHRFTLHHYGYSTDAQAKRVAALGAHVSANPFYLYALSDGYSRVGLGPQRAREMSRLGALAREGVPVSLHSDFTMAPAEPLRLAWVATNRINAEGDVMAPELRLTRDQALRAVTLDAARAIQMEDEVGSIEVGKRADFTVLLDDPTEVPIQALADVRIWGTIFEGRAFPLAR